MGNGKNGNGAVAILRNFGIAFGILVTLVGFVFAIGGAYSSTKHVADDVEDHETRLRSVEEICIRNDDRLDYIVESIDEIKQDLRRYNDD